MKFKNNATFRVTRVLVVLGFAFAFWQLCMMRVTKD
jgi:hypothetical protein